jgi:hypothetical protein
MDYEGIYSDLEAMAKEAAHRAAMWLDLDEDGALKKLRFAADCEQFRKELFFRGCGR